MQPTVHVTAHAHGRVALCQFRVVPVSAYVCAKISNDMSSGERDSLAEEIEKLSHEDLLEITQSTLRRLLASDALLSDLPSDVTTDEVLAQIAVVQGQSITVNLLRNTESPLGVVVSDFGEVSVFVFEVMFGVAL